MGMAGRENVSLTVTTGKYEIRLKVLCGCAFVLGVRLELSAAVCTRSAHTLLWCHQQGHIQGTASFHSASGLVPALRSQTHTLRLRGGWAFLCVCVCTTALQTKKKKRKKQEERSAYTCVSVYTTNDHVCRRDKDCLHSPQCTFHIWWRHS